MLYILLVVVFFVVYAILKLFFITKRFFKTAGTAVDLYNILQELLENASQAGVHVKEQKIVVQYHHYNFEFENIEEAYKTVELICNKALEDYQVLLNRGFVNCESEKEKTTLINICNKIRMERWQKQFFNE